MSKPKLLSLIVVIFYIVYLIVATLQGRVQSAGQNLATRLFACLLWILSAMACIWYADEIGPYLGSGRYRQFIVPDWSVFVRFAGWILLLLPVFIAIARKIW